MAAIDGLALGTLLLGIVAIVYFGKILVPQNGTQDGGARQEPPKVHASFWSFGHLLGLYRYGHEYFTILSQRNALPIYTIDIFSQRFYVVNDADLMIRIQRSSKLFSFNHIIAATTKMFCGVDEEAMKKIQEGLEHADLHQGYLNDMRKAVGSALAPDTDLDDMCNVMLGRLSHVINRLESTNPADSHDLWRLSCHITTSASTRAAYGPRSPFDLDQSLTDGFWAFKGNIVPFIINFLPQIFAPEAYRGRERVIDALQQYFSTGGPAMASAFMNARHATSEKHGLSTGAMARLELGNLIGLLGNTAPTLFWLLMQICLEPDLLYSLRGEVDAITSIETDTSAAHPRVYRLVVDNIGIACPLLMSTYKEILRLRSRSMSSRVVSEDTIIDGQLLRKGAFLQMPSYVFHSSTDFWGQQSRNFCPRRFFAPDSKSVGTRHAKAGAFRPFGGGQSLCSGRHFATLEVVAAAAMFVARYDLALQAGSWNPKAEATSQSLATSFEMPAGKIRVKIADRAGCEPHARWEFATPVSKVNFSSLQ